MTEIKIQPKIEEVILEVRRASGEIEIHKINKTEIIEKKDD